MNTTKIYIQTFIRVARCLVALPLLCLLACSDDLLVDIGSNIEVPEGQDATITLNWDVVESAKISRATAMTEAQESRVNSLWVGIYNVKSGELTSATFFINDSGTSSDVNNNFDYEVKENAAWVTNYNLEEAKDLVLKNAKSGESYIVAVANVLTNYGIMEADFDDGETFSDGTANIHPDASDGTLAANARPRKILRYLLERATTWERFKSIRSVLLEPTSITRTTADFPMTGYYIAGNHPDQWYNAQGNPTETVTIYPETNKLTGKIHLRRQESYVKFNIKSAANVDVSLKSWQLVNIPALSPLLENGKNVGDISTGLISRPDDIYDEGNYTHGLENFSFDAGSSDMVGTFDFYCFGSNRTGQDWVSNYNDREKELKNSDGTNSGKYLSLMSKDGETLVDALSNENNAPYIVLTADVTYYARLTTDAQGNITSHQVVSSDYKNNADVVHRSGTAVFTIHLGYCEGTTDAEKARDFRCLRNTKYTYNVTINSIDNIRVEVQSDNETQPGMEGSITDSRNNIIQLDAHYNTFNIQLTNQERLTLSYDIEAPIQDIVYKYSSATDGIDYETNNAQAFLCDWVRFRPAYAEDVLAVFKKNDLYRSTNSLSGKDETEPWTLMDLNDVVAYQPVYEDRTVIKYGYKNPAPSQEVINLAKAQGDVNAMISYLKSNGYSDWLDESHYYTVFINEYVYYKDKNGKDLLTTDGEIKEWYNFTDLPDRKLWLLNETARQLSPDGESSYISSKYLIQQSSIETYYSTKDYNTTAIKSLFPDKGYNTISNIAPTALGVEHVDENLSTSRVWGNVTIDGYDDSNGRYNVWHALGGTEQSTIAATRWADITVSPSTDKRWIKAFNNPSDIKVERVLSAAGIKPVFDVGSTLNYQCMNRNRDENGDGKIDANEVKWVVPATRMYFRMLIGEESFTNPLIDFNFLLPTSYAAGSYGNLLVHFPTSNYERIWMEEGMSLSRNDFGGARVRCVRTLGIPINTMSKESRMQNAYRFFDMDGNDGADSNSGANFDRGGYFVMQYYEQKNNATPVSAGIPLHDISQPQNKTSFIFQFGGATGSQNAKTVKYQPTGSAGSDADLKIWIDSNPCDVFNTGNESGWRVPSFQELALMFLVEDNDGMSLGFKSSETKKYNSCTTEYLSSSSNRVLGVYNTGGSNPSILTTAGQGWAYHHNQYVRCVRDVILK